MPTKLKSTGSIFEQPVKLPESCVSDALWHGLTTVGWAYAGALFSETLPIPIFLVPFWAILRFFWPVFLCWFALRFHKHYLYVCTATYTPKWREETRKRLQRRAFLWAFFPPVTFLVGLWGAFRCCRETWLAWMSWFIYNKQYLTEPGILQSPAGSQATRVWHYRFTVFLVAAAIMPRGNWPAVNDLSPTGMTIFIVLVLITYTPGVLVLLFSSALLGVNLKELKEAREDADL